MLEQIIKWDLRRYQMMDREDMESWEQAEWSMWHRVPDGFKKWATYLLLRFIRYRCGREEADFWAWERTPLPVGFPFPSQLVVGLARALRGRRSDA